MTDVIDFPTSPVEADWLPEPGDRYQAYALFHQIRPPMLAFVFPDWSINFFRYDQLEHMAFRLLGDDGNRDGEAAFELVFGTASRIHEILVTGRNIFDLCIGIGDHAVRWLWELPKERAAAKPGEPVVHAINIREKATA